MDNTPLKRNISIDALRGFAMILVLLDHSIIRYPIDLLNISWCAKLHLWLSCVHMPIFFLISGYCFSYRNNYLQYMIKKAKRLLLPFALFHLIDITPRFFLKNMVNIQYNGLQDELVRIIDGNDIYWFLFTLFFILSVMPLFHYAYQKHKVITLLLSTILCCFSGNLSFGTVCIQNIFHYQFFCMVGYAIKNKKLIEMFSLWSKKQRCGLVISFGILHVLCFQIETVFTNEWTSLFTAITGTFFFLAIFSQLQPWKFFTEVGGYTLPIYVIHGYFRIATRTFTCNILDVTSPFLLIILNFICVFTGTWILIRFILIRFSLFRSFFQIR